MLVRYSVVVCLWWLDTQRWYVYVGYILSGGMSMLVRYSAVVCLWWLDTQWWYVYGG